LLKLYTKMLVELMITAQDLKWTTSDRADYLVLVIKIKSNSASAKFQVKKSVITVCYIQC
jgi:hypothetical protein